MLTPKSEVLQIKQEEEDGVKIAQLATRDFPLIGCLPVCLPIGEGPGKFESKGDLIICFYTHLRFM